MTDSISLFQTFLPGRYLPHKAALWVGGLEGCTVIKVKARADESAERFCCTSDCLRGQRSAGNCMNMHGTKAAHPQLPQVPDGHEDTATVKTNVVF